MDVLLKPGPILPEDAETKHGIVANHERMPNGELRFRLMSKNGDGYIRTVGSTRAGWQNSHQHRKVKETYVVQSGWMLLVSLRNGAPVFECIGVDEVVTTEPGVPHNVYLPVQAVVHTVKHGSTDGKDWEAVPGLDAITMGLSEANALAKAAMTNRRGHELDPRYGSYVDIYNNFDNLIWRLPAFFVAAIALLTGFIGSSFTQGTSSLAAPLWALFLLPVGIFSLLGAYSMWRIRIHHSLMGAHLKAMEANGYFHDRCRTVNRLFPPPAPTVFILFFLITGLLLLVIGGLAAVDYPPIAEILQKKLRGLN